MSQGFYRVAWVMLPLLVVAIVSAKEWPSRAQMIEGAHRDAVYMAAVQWDGVVNGTKPPAPVAPKRLEAPVKKVVATTPPSPPAPVVIPVASGGKVLLLGDSLMGGIGPGLRQELPKSFTLSDKHRSSTGLTNQAYYDWPAEAGKFATSEKPQWVFIHLGGNDGQDMMLGGKWVGFGTDAWKAEYLARAKLMVENIRLAAPGAPIVWIGLPMMRPEKYERKTRVIAAIQEQAALEAGIVYASGVVALGEAYAKQGTGVDGKPHVLRSDDGIHYSREGGRVLAHAARKLTAGLP